MAIQVLVEPVANNGYRARSGEPHGLTAEGATQAEALRKLGELLDHRLANGASEGSGKPPARTEGNPWIKFAGMFKDDPYFDKWQESIEEYRRAVDEDPNCP